MKAPNGPAIVILKKGADLDCSSNKKALNAFLRGSNKSISFFVGNDFNASKNLMDELDNTYFKLVAYVKSSVDCYYDPLTECYLTSVVAE